MLSVNTRHATTISWLRFIVLLTRRRAPCLFLATPTPRRRFQWLQNRIPVRKKERLANPTGTIEWRSVLPNCACTSAAEHQQWGGMYETPKNDSQATTSPHELELEGYRSPKLQLAILHDGPAVRAPERCFDAGCFALSAG